MSNAALSTVWRCAMILSAVPLGAVGAASCAKGASVPTDGGDDLGFQPPACNEGDVYRCDGDVAVRCDDPTAKESCSDAGEVCAGGLGCVVCVPGQGSCADGTATVCKYDGSGYQDYACDPAQGMVCEPDGCKGACAWGTLGASYVGCDYWPTVTLNHGVWSGFEFAVVLSNLGETPANVIVTRGADEIEALVVAPGELATLRLPWVTELKGPDPNLMSQPQWVGDSRSVVAGAYRVRSDQPIAAYQFSPLDYEIVGSPDCPQPAGEGCFSYSNDASLLLPSHVLGTTYHAMAWKNLGCRPGFVTVTAIHDGTEVKLERTGQMMPGGGFTDTGYGKATLDQGDVLQIVGMQNGGPFCFAADAGDVSGTIVRATKPVQVIAGHGCANLPAADVDACDHVEETMFPIETLGKHYIIGAPQAPEAQSPYTIRVAAIEEGTTIQFDPPIVGDLVLGPNDPPLEIPYVSGDVVVTASARILIAHYLHGTDANDDPSPTGDPAQSLAVPTEQFRGEYTFLAPGNYQYNYVNVVAPAGAIVTLDGAAVPADSFAPVGDGTYAVARVLLDASEVHRAESSEPFGITVYGYGDYTSYMYPGGLKLDAIAPVPQ
jgi:hypothetical protein